MRITRMQKRLTGVIVVEPPLRCNEQTVYSEFDVEFDMDRILRKRFCVKLKERAEHEWRMKVLRLINTYISIEVDMTQKHPRSTRAP